jgi:WD repeat-containing protein 19
VRVPSFLRRTFTLLHSYMLVKKLVKRGDHDGAARMLLRIAESISKFPSHKARNIDHYFESFARLDM